jgi:hypothetical protein
LLVPERRIKSAGLPYPKMNRPGLLFKQSKMESLLQQTILKGTILRMPGILSKA